MPSEKTISSPMPAETPATADFTAAAIEVEGLHKSFRIPTHRIDSLKERIVRPFSPRDYRELRALNGISFDIRQGEFFGIVGRNGSGKSTLLKLLASIYRADAGTIRMAGRLAPFIELGVGFNTELTARENVVLNGVMMGLTPRETRGRLDAVLDFAELTEFVDLKLKNYSSGMLVRLAFSVMMQADADVLLIDEVLAVGDAAFQQKCTDAFHQMKAEDKTIVLVTHEMGTVETYCDRAMLIDDGHIQHIGDPAEVGRRYLRLNFERGAEKASGEKPASSSEFVRVVNVAVEGDDGEPAEGIEHGSAINLRMSIEVISDISDLSVAFALANADGTGVFFFGKPILRADGTSSLRAGDRVEVRTHIENQLTAGRYYVHSAVNRISTATVLVHVHNSADFVVFGAEDKGVVVLPHTIDTEVQAGETAL